MMRRLFGERRGGRMHRFNKILRPTRVGEQCGAHTERVLLAAEYLAQVHHSDLTLLDVIDELPPETKGMFLNRTADVVPNHIN